MKPRPSRSIAETEIRAAQAKRLRVEQQLEEALNELATVVKAHLDQDASAAEISAWITTEKKPDGVSRQYVYKLVQDRGANNGKVTKPRPRRAP